jgi:hypothetical protein
MQRILRNVASLPGASKNKRSQQYVVTSSS